MPFSPQTLDFLVENRLHDSRDWFKEHKEDYKKLVIAGGVSANSGLRKKMEDECKRRGYALYQPPLSLCGDNAAMIGAQGYYEFLAGHTAGLDLNGVASLPIDAE